MTATTAVFVPGSFAQPELLHEFMQALRTRGYDVHPIHLSTALPKEATPPGKPIPTMYDDAAEIAAQLNQLAEQNKCIVVFAHSYSGMPVSEAVQGLSISARQQQGKLGGVVRLAYCSCLIGDVGQAAGELMKSKTENRIPSHMNEDGWMYYADEDLDTVARVSFSDLPHDEGLQWAKKLGWHSSVSFGDKLRYAGYKDVAVSWLLCEEDLAIPKNIQRTAIDLIERKSGSKVDVTSIAAGHVPMIAQQEAVLDWMVAQLDKQD